jgi:hypothetical protein
MNIFSDFHHFGLMTSLRMLFVDRLKHKIFIPTGLEWFPNYWGIAEPYGNDPRTADQYLNHPLNIPHVKEITLEEFKSMPIDIVIASVPENIPHYKKLIANFHPEAKFVVQIGNMFHEVLSNLPEVPNLLASTIAFDVPPTCNAVFYHQNFDLSVFKPTWEVPQNKIVSFIVNLKNTGHADKYYQLKELLPEYEFRSYGGSCDDGVISTVQEIAKIMNESKFIFQCKWDGDGFGHNLYNSYACGKPVITSRHDYEDKLGAELLEDGISCIDIDGKTMPEVVDIIRDMTFEKYNSMCWEAYKKFVDHVNYDKEQEMIRDWLQKLH